MKGIIESRKLPSISGLFIHCFNIFIRATNMTVEHCRKVEYMKTNPILFFEIVNSKIFLKTYQQYYKSTINIQQIYIFYNSIRALTFVIVKCT